MQVSGPEDGELAAMVISDIRFLFSSRIRFWLERSYPDGSWTHTPVWMTAAWTHTHATPPAPHGSGVVFMPGGQVFVFLRRFLLLRWEQVSSCGGGAAPQCQQDMFKPRSDFWLTPLLIQPGSQRSSSAPNDRRQQPSSKSRRRSLRTSRGSAVFTFD